MSHNHMMDVAFTVISDESDPDKLTEAALIDGMERRLQDLKKMPPGEALEAFGHCDGQGMPMIERCRESIARWQCRLCLEMVNVRSSDHSCPTEKLMQAARGDYEEAVES